MEECSPRWYVNAAVSSMKPHKAAGPDEITGAMIKFGGEILWVALAHLVNRCLTEGRHPSQWKKCDVTVIYKNKGSIHDCNNYRPISLCPVTGKILEHLFTDYLYSELEDRAFFTPTQGGFRRGTGCTETLVYNFERWYNTCKSNPNHCRVVNAVLADIQKAFDMIEDTKNEIF